MTSPLFRPFASKKLSLANRLVMAPMTRSKSPDSIPGADVAAYYRRRAEGGVGLIITEGTTVDRPAASNDTNVPDFHSPASLAGWLSGLDGERVVLVGHEPHLSKAVTWLMAGSGSRPIVGLKKAQALMLETEKAAAGSAVLVWSLPPKALRRLS